MNPEYYPCAVLSRIGSWLALAFGLSVNAPPDGFAQSVAGAGNALSISINGHMAVSNAPALSNAFTFEAWVKVLNTNSFNSNGHHTILSRGGGQLPTSATDYIFQVQPGGVLALFAAGAWDVSPAPIITPEVWTHVAVTFDGAMKRFFSNGVEVASMAREGALQPLPATEALFVGRQGSACNCNFFAGDLDEVRVWNVARSGAEIADRYNRSLTSTEPGLAAYYRFDVVGPGLTVADESGQGRPGVISGNFLHVPSGATVFTPPGIVSFSVTTANLGLSVFRGAVTLGGLPGLTWFEWGTNGGFQFAGTVVAIPADDFTTNAVSASLDLPPGPWQARLAASNALGVTSQTVLFESPLFGEASVSGMLTGADQCGAWADCNNDGRLDAVVTGNRPALFLFNLQNGLIAFSDRFVPSVATAPNGVVSFGDYDRDGWLDLLLGTAAGGNGLWRGSGSYFVQQPLNGLPETFPGAVEAIAWGDYDNDGRLDFLFPRPSGLPLWRNTGGGFTGVPLGGYPGLRFTAAAWVDYDNDGWLDYMVTGFTGADSLMLLQRNTGDGFSNVAGHPFPAIHSGDAAWGDFDNDGRLDCLIAGFTRDSRVSSLWRNTGNGFSPVPIAGLPGLNSADVAWGDYDNDGRLDFLISGSTGFRNTVQLWRNTGAGFTNVMDEELPLRSVSWGDYDNDGRLDLLLAGQQALRLWRNRTPITNTPPAAPTGLAMTTTSNGVMFSWNAATDAQTPSTGLNYNVRAGTTPGGIDLISPHADPVTGFRRLPELGNAQMRRFMFLNGVTNGQTIYWSVQAVDTAFAGGAWASEASTVSLPQLTINPSSNGQAHVSWKPPTSGWRLQENSIPDTDGWSNSPSGELNPATLPAAESQRFFRLQGP